MTENTLFDLDKTFEKKNPRLSLDWFQVVEDGGGNLYICFFNDKHERPIRVFGGFEAQPFGALHDAIAQYLEDDTAPFRWDNPVGASITENLEIEAVVIARGGCSESLEIYTQHMDKAGMIAFFGRCF